MILIIFHHQWWCLKDGAKGKVFVFVLLCVTREKLSSHHHCCFYPACTLKNILTDYSHICILLTIKHFKVAILKHCLGTPLSIQWPVTVEQAYGFQPYPCSLVTDMHTYKLQGLCYTQRGPSQSFSSPRPHLMTSSLIGKIFFSIIRQALASDMPQIGLTCLGRR